MIGKAIAVAILALGSTVQAQDSEVVVEIWTGGDDGLTQRLRDAVTQAVNNHPRFVSADGMGPALTEIDRQQRAILTIPTHVEWRRVQNRVEVSYRVTLVRGERSLAREGDCWEDELADCANQIIRLAETL